MDTAAEALSDLGRYGAELGAALVLGDITAERAAAIWAGIEDRSDALILALQVPGTSLSESHPRETNAIGQVTVLLVEVEQMLDDQHIKEMK